MKYGLFYLCIVVCFVGCSNNGSRLETIGAVQPATIAKRIAIITPATHPSLEQIEQGFMQTLLQCKDCDFKFSVFNANGSEVLLRSQVEEVSTQSYDLIFTIAAHPTCVAKEVLAKKHLTTPLIFGAVASPEKLGIVGSGNRSDEHITGVVEKSDYRLQLEILLILKPNVQHVLLAYNPTQGAGLEDDKQEVAMFLREKKISLTCVEVYRSNEIQSKLSGLLEGKDVLLVLKDNTVVPAIPCLAKLCSQYGVTLCASDLDSGRQGAAFSFGVNERDYGVECAKKALCILQENQNPAAVCVTNLDNYKVILNSKVMASQALVPDARLLFLIKSGQMD